MPALTRVRRSPLATQNALAADWRIPSMTTFALIHGGAHGGWCWEQLVPELVKRGHEAVAPDLPIDDEQAGTADWADVVVAALDDTGRSDDVVVVGHSLGGLCTPVVAAQRPVRRMVFLGALVPQPGRPFADYLAEHPEVLRYAADQTAPDASVELSSETVVIPWEVARHNFYQDLDEDVAERAWARLRPNAMPAFTEPCPLTEWPAVPSTYILMRDDNSVNPEWSRTVAAEISADLIELPGGHSPFYARPDELA